MLLYRKTRTDIVRIRQRTRKLIDSFTKAGLENILTDVPLCEEETRDDDTPVEEVPPEEVEQDDSCLPTQKSMDLPLVNQNAN